MASITNNWVGYLDRSYQQIKASLLNRLTQNNPEITDHSESNILIIIISMFAGISEMLNYYIDNMSREAYLISVRKFESAVKLVRILDYRIKARTPEVVDLLFSLRDNAGNLITIASDVTIPKNTAINTANGIIFYTSANLIIPAGSSQGSIGAVQTTYLNNIILGQTTGVQNEVFPIGTTYQHGTLSITINGEIYTNVGTFGLSKSTDKHFIVEIDVDGIAKAVFGDGTKGVIPPSGYDIIATYQTTLGPEGKANIGTLINFVNTFNVIGVDKVTVENPLSSSGGSLYEDVNSIRKNAPLSTRTLDRAVTPQDYKDIVSLAPGVGKSAVNYCCGKTVDIYIAPSGGGIAQTPLLDSVKTYIDDKKMVTTKVVPKPAGETYIFIKIRGKATFRVSNLVAEADVLNTLLDFGSFNKQEINSSIRLSDIYRSLDELNTIDYIDIEEFYSIPYPRPRNHTTTLNWVIKTLPGSIAKTKWRLEWSGTNFRIFKENTYLGTLIIGETYTDPGSSIELTISNGLYQTGMNWDFTVYPYNKNIELDDYTIPIIKEEYLDIDIEAQNRINPKTSC